MLNEKAKKALELAAWQIAHNSKPGVIVYCSKSATFRKPRRRRRRNFEALEAVVWESAARAGVITSSLSCVFIIQHFLTDGAKFSEMGPPFFTYLRKAFRLYAKDDSEYPLKFFLGVVDELGTLFSDAMKETDTTKEAGI